MVGKGPSLNSEVIESKIRQGYSLISVNDAAAFMPHIYFEFAFSNDLEAVLKIDFANVNSFVTPQCVRADITPDRREIGFLLKCLGKINELGERVYYYNINADLVDFNYPHYFTSRSTVESVVQTLALSGVKEIHFTGIDGGMDYHSHFKGFTENYDAQFVHMKTFKDFYGLTYFGLNDQVMEKFGL